MFTKVRKEKIYNLETPKQVKHFHLLEVNMLELLFRKSSDRACKIFEEIEICNDQN